MKLNGLYDSFPRRYGKAKTILYDKQDFINFVNRDNGHNDVFISVFAYTNLKEKDGIMKIDSESAIFDKIFVDMDFKDWLNYDTKLLKKFKENLIEDYLKNKLNRRQKRIIKLIKESGKLTDERDIDFFISLYEKHHKIDAENRLYGCVKKLDHYLRKLDVIRIWSFSGGGFHLYLYISNDVISKKIFYRNCLDKLSKLVCDPDDEYYDRKFRLRKRKLWDPHSPPKLSQMVRVIGTYNPKRKLYCTSLTENDIDSGLVYIKEKAKTPDTTIHYLGKKIMKFSDSLDSNETLESCSLTYELGNYNYPDNLKELLHSLGIIFDEVPPCIKQFLRLNLKLDYHERYVLITFLYRNGLSKNEIIEVLKLVLTTDRLYHCCGVIKDNYKPSGIEKSRIETQIQDIIENDYYISCTQIRNTGLCISTCIIKDVLYYVS